MGNSNQGAAVSPNSSVSSSASVAAPMQSLPPPTQLDAGKLTIVSSKKIDRKQLMQVGDSETLRNHLSSGAPSSTSSRSPAATDGKTTTTTASQPADAARGSVMLGAKVPEVRNTKCRYCCMLFGGGMSTGLSVVLCGLHVGFGVFKNPHLNATLPQILKQVGWLALPSAMVGTTLHYFLAESMWSSRRSSYGVAWLKAIAINTSVWMACVTAGTLAWRHLVRRTAWGNRWYFLYPIPSSKIETRVIEQPGAYFSGMGWTYWCLGIFTGTLGYAGCVSAVVWQDKVHFMMSPVGPYARACVPRWRREAIASSAGFDLPPTQ